MPSEINSAFSARRDFPFVGRQRELSLLLSALRQAPAVVMLEGEAGVGKSRLVREAEAVLASDGDRVLTSLCHPLRDPFPFGPVLDALRGVDPWLAAGDPISRAAGVLAPLLPDLADRLPPPPAGTAPTDRLQMVQGVRALLSAVAPVILVVEDLHWVDDATRELLLLLARDLPEGLGMVLTYRAEDLPHRTPVLGSAFHRAPGTSGAEIALRPLAESHVQELATAALGVEAAVPLVRLLFDRSAGLPLVVEEDLWTIMDQAEAGQLLGRSAEGDWKRLDVPRGVREAITGRLAGLSDDAREVVAAAAVLEVPAREPLLAEVAELSADRVTAALVEALRAAVLREDGPAAYGFRHSIARQAVYGHLSAPHRTALHRRAAHVLGGLPVPPLVQIAHHTRAVGDLDQWLEQAQAAADQAIAVGDEGTAYSLLHDVLRQHMLSVRHRSSAALALARIAVNRVDHVSTVAALRRILADPRLATATRGEIRLGLGLLMSNQANDVAWFRECERAIPELGSRPDLAARAMTALALREDREHIEEAQNWLDRAEKTLRHSTDPAAWAALRASRLSILAQQGDPAVWELLDELPRGGPPPVVRETARVLFNVSEYALLLGHDDRARRLATEALLMAEQVSMPMLVCFCKQTLVVADWRGGAWAASERRSAALRAEFPDMSILDIGEALMPATIAAARGERPRAIELYERVLRPSGAKPDHIYVAYAAAGVGRIRLAQDDPSAAWSVALPSLEALRRNHGWVWAVGLVPMAVEAAVALGSAETAAALVEEVENGIADRDSPAAVAEVHTARGHLLKDRDPLLAFERFDRARVLWRDMGRPYEMGLATENAARMLIDSSPQDAAERLQQAVGILEQLGADSDASRCHRLLRTIGLERPPAHGRHGYGEQLSPRELQVARLLAGGSTNREIAQSLFLSPRTVEHHVARVLKKLQVTRGSVQDALRDVDDL
ncbi:ATP-binding protein [Streptomyces fildesensis]|uniref:ATP-binding protein n=1 Tax=Streptomyces fildesensis TaxID=375757 RepID=A0ABW8C6B9_9ACTN